MTLCGIRVGALLRFYRYRLRRYGVQELFAAVGIAVGVALLFAVQVANTSITGSAEQLVRGIMGGASLQLAATASDGFDERLAARADRLPSVLHVAPLLRNRVAVRGDEGTEWIELLGGTPALADLGGSLTRNFGSHGLQLVAGIALPQDVARAVGAKAGDTVSVIADARSHRVKVGAVVGTDTVGPIAHTMVAIAPLDVAQLITGSRDKISQLIVEARPGRQAEAERELRALAGSEATVRPADVELDLLRQAAKPNDQSTALFAGIGAMVGFLFALNAMLITGPDRRSLVADLRMQGYARRQILLILGFEALVLGAVASVVGLLLGDLLSRLAFGNAPEYLTIAFPVGGQRVVEPATVVLAFAGGVLAALAASLRPVFDMRRGKPLDSVFHDLGEPGEAVGPGTARAMLFIALALVLGVTVVILARPEATIGGVLALALATVLLTPAALSAAVRRVEGMTRGSRRFNLVWLAMRELQGAKTRAMTLAAVGALAVYGSVTVAGAHADLLRGLDRHFKEHVGNADLWVTNVGDVLTTRSFDAARARSVIAADPSVAALRVYRGGLFDVAGRRVYVTGRPVADDIMIPPSQLLEGNASQATRLLRGTGWVAISEELASAHGLGLGDRVTLPGAGALTRFRIAALTTNLGWPPGAMIMNADDYARAWHVSEPTALEVDLTAGTAPAAGQASLQRALGSTSGLAVRTQAERLEDYRQMERQGLTRLAQISTLLALAAALAMASAIGAAIWERRERLAAMKVQGFSPGQLWRALMYETALVVAVGALLGGVLGIYGHFLASRYLQLTTGFPAPFSFEARYILLALALVVGTAGIVTGLRGRAAIRTPLSVGLRG